GRAGGAAREPDGGVVTGQGLRSRPHRLVRRVGRLGVVQGEVTARPRWLPAAVVAVVVGVVALGAGLGVCTHGNGSGLGPGRAGALTSSAAAGARGPVAGGPLGTLRPGV